MTKEFSMPKTLAGCADAMYKVKQRRLEMQKEVDALQEQETLLSDYLINNLPKDDAVGIQGRVARATVVVREIPRVENWDLVFAYVKRRNCFELLQKRLADGAIRERWDAGKSIPGVGKFNLVKISLSKVG